MIITLHVKWPFSPCFRLVWDMVSSKGGKLHMFQSNVHLKRRNLGHCEFAVDVILTKKECNCRFLSTNSWKI
jgi:hypothetical protein